MYVLIEIERLLKVNESQMRIRCASDDRDLLEKVKTMLEDADSRVATEFDEEYFEEFEIEYDILTLVEYFKLKESDNEIC